MPLTHIENPEEVLRFSAQRPKVLQSLQRTSIGGGAAAIISRAENMPVDTLACHEILLVVLLPAEQIHVPVPATRDFLDVVVAGFQMEFMTFGAANSVW